MNNLRLIGTLFFAAMCFISQFGHANVTFTASGLSAKDTPVTFEANLGISGDILTVVLTNNSPGPSLNPDDTLGSFYFDILDASNNRPTLTYVSAVGDVYLADKDAPDVLSEAGADLMAINAGDYTWQFKNMDDSFNPYLGFGIGTVGNNLLNPNGFNGNIVGAVDYTIYNGDVSTQNLDGKNLVLESATFTFEGLTGFTEQDIVNQFAFGLGTAPDSLIGHPTVPVPGAVLLAGIGTALVGTLRRKSFML